MPIVLHGIYMPLLFNKETIISPAPPISEPSSIITTKDLSFKIFNKYSVLSGFINLRLISVISRLSSSSFLYAV